MKILKFFLLIIIIMLAICFSLFIVLKDEEKKPAERFIKYPDKILIQEYTKFTATPFRSLRKNAFLFEIMIESFQNPELVETDLGSISLLEDNVGDTYKPSKWEILKQSKYQTYGRMIFEPLPNDVKEITLMISDMEDKTLKWDLRPSTENVEVKIQIP